MQLAGSAGFLMAIEPVAVGGGGGGNAAGGSGKDGAGLGDVWALIEAPPNNKAAIPHAAKSFVIVVTRV
jgi:hypothetical protein